MTNSFVLDCSTTIAWCFEDECDQYSQTILENLKACKALVPSLWTLEVTNVLLMSEKRNRLMPADSTRFIKLLNSLPIYVSDLVFSNTEIINVARNYKLTSYDAIYLLLAMHEGLELATKDKALIQACKESGVKILTNK